MDKILQFVEEEDNLLCVKCDCTFSTATKKSHHWCKDAKSSNDLVSVALRHVS